jgi:hypothetical protein
MSKIGNATFDDEDGDILVDAINDWGFANPEMFLELVAEDFDAPGERQAVSVTVEEVKGISTSGRVVRATVKFGVTYMNRADSEDEELSAQNNVRHEIELEIEIESAEPLVLARVDSVLPGGAA